MLPKSKIAVPRSSSKLALQRKRSDCPRRMREKEIRRQGRQCPEQALTTSHLALLRVPGGWREIVLAP